MRFIYLSLLFLLSLSNVSFGQCDPTVPLYVIDLSSTPDTTWVLYEEDALNRNGQCCTANPNENCIQFEITLHPNTAGVFFDYDGAGAYGSLNWQLDCGTEYNLKDTICITGGGTFTLTFCKPGSDNGNYTLISVAKPTFPEDQFVPANCAQPVQALGVTENSIVWQSISPGAPGDYNSLLSCTDCLEPVYTPDPNGPSVVEFEVCGYPILDYCVGAFDYCDTMSFTTLDSIQLGITPLNPTYCSGGDVTLYANATGGDNNFTYYWYDAGLNLVGTADTLVVNAAGTYTCEVRDGNYEVGYCDNFSTTVTVVETLPPVVDAGADQVLCADDPEAELTATLQYATTGFWSGGAGTYSPSTNDLSISYTPTTAEIASGSVVLTFTTTGVGGGCTDDNDDVELFFIDTIQTDLTDINLGCYGTEASVNPAITGGLAPFTYSWTNGATTLTNDLGLGTHCLSIEDANGCQVTECITVTSPPELDLTMSSMPATTDGGSDGTATATPSGGTAPYTYLWNTSGTNSTETGLSYGVYTVVVTDANGCIRNGSVVVNEPQCNGFSLSTTSTDVLCNSDSTGTVTVVETGGTSPFTYSWNDYAGQTTATATNLPQAVYEVTVTDDNGCIAIQTAVVNEPDALLNTMAHNDATTQGGTNGDATASVSGGFGAYAYLWSTTATTPNISGLSTDWYYLTITDDNGCTLQDSVFINEPPCDQFLLYVSTTSPLCNGDLTGEADLTIANGIAPYTISWSTGETGVTSITGAAAGIHTVEVTDAQGCYTFLNYGISEPSPLSIGLSSTPSTCAGYDNGTIDMTVVGGSYPYYSFNWSTGQSTEDVINLAPASYSVTVTDQNGCQESSFTIINDPAPLSLSYVVQHVTCFEGTDGSIDVTPIGGVGSYSFDWSNGATTEDLSGIDVGGYILNITDGNFCDFDTPVTIYVNEPTEVLVDSLSVHCPTPGDSQSNVEVFPTGGNSNYAISFDNGSTYLPYGTYNDMLATGASYNIQVMDVNGCLSPVVALDIDPTLIIDSILFNKCYTTGQTDETVTVYSQGGAPDYSISYNNGTSFDAAGVYSALLPISNSYNVVAADTNGCLSTPFAIVLPSVFTASSVVSTNYNGQDISCNGNTDAAINATVSGGTVAYTYAWEEVPSTGVFATIEDPSGLGAGDYQITVTDAFGCTVQSLISVTEPTVLGNTIAVVSDYNGEDISCHGVADGSVQIVGTGGTLPYVYLWSDSQTTDVASNLSVGTYSVTLTDINGCITSNSITLTEPDTLNISSIVTDVTCNGINDGSIDITSIGGVMPYGYVWDHGPTTEDVSGLGIGSFGVTLTDANGCVYYHSTSVIEPDVLDLSVVETNTTCFNFSDGAVDLTVAGGTLPYAYSWDNAGETTEDITNLIAGVYTVTVTDDNGCVETISGTVTQPDSLALAGVISNALCYNDANGEIDITLIGGTEPYSFDWSTLSTDEDQTGLVDGTYTVDILDANGCVQFGSYTVTEPDSLYIELDSPLNFHDHNIDLFGGSDGEIDATVYGGTQPYTYNWSENSTTEDVFGLTAGLYELEVTDENGCMAFANITLTEPFDLELPTAFSPNNDNANDFYDIHGIEAYPDNIFIVHNRWGNVVFETTNYHNVSNNWAGQNQSDEMLPDGVYYVILEINSGEIKRNTYVHIKTH